MTTYTEQDCIEAIERNWGEIESYEWDGDHEEPAYRAINVVFTAAAAEAIANRCNASPISKITRRKLSARDVVRKSFDAQEVARELGHSAYDCPAGDCPQLAKFVDGGVAVFADRAEMATWEAQV